VGEENYKITLEKKIGMGFLILAGIFFVHMLANWPPIRMRRGSNDLVYLKLLLPPGIILTFMKKTREIPRGILALGIFIVTIYGVHHLFRPSLFLGWQSKTLSSLISTFLYMLLPLAYIILGTELLLLKDWARKLLMGLSLLTAIVAIAVFIRHMVWFLKIFSSLMKAVPGVKYDFAKMIGWHIFNILVNIGIFWALCRRNLKTLFKQGAI